MKEYIKYNDREFILTAFNIKTERDLLLTAGSDSNENEIDYDTYLRIVEPYIISKQSIYSLTNDEKIFLLYKLRATSISNILSISTKCGCGSNFKTNIDLNELLSIKEIDENVDLIKRNIKIKNVFSDNYSDYIENYDYNELSINEAEIIEEYINNHRTAFNYEKNIKCVKCGSFININLKSPHLLKSCFSENTLAEFYKGLTRLSYLGKVPLNCILNDMYPFERELFINLINQEIEEQNKSKTSKPH